MKSFDDFWKFLQSHEQWFEYTCKMRFHDRDPKSCAKDCYAYLISDPKKFTEMQKEDATLRKYFVSWLMKAPVKPMAPQLQQVEVSKEPVVNHFVDEETYQRRMKEWRDAVLSVDNNFKVPKISKKEAIEEGDWLPKKKADYVPIDPHLYYLKDGISKFSGRKYKGMVTFPGFEHYNFGMVSVYADSKANAEDILRKAHRYANRKLK